MLTTFQILSFFQNGAIKFFCFENKKIFQFGSGWLFGKYNLRRRQTRSRSRDWTIEYPGRVVWSNWFQAKRGVLQTCCCYVLCSRAAEVWAAMAGLLLTSHPSISWLQSFFRFALYHTLWESGSQGSNLTWAIYFFQDLDDTSSTMSVLSDPAADSGLSTLKILFMAFATEFFRTKRWMAGSAGACSSRVGVFGAKNGKHSSRG